MSGSTLPKLEFNALQAGIASGDISCLSLVQACIERIEARETDVLAWEWIDPGAALEAAREADEKLKSLESVPPLHGIPVGVKDIIDTAQIPTRNGCQIDNDRIPQNDAALVSNLKKAGAIVLGKTVSTELAYLHPSKTRNPNDLTHAPGGSSSGSAAAVADGMVPLAIGTQTGGSVIRPASFCGVIGYKPSFGLIPRDGVLMQSPSLDTVGVFANDLAGAATLASALCENVLDLQAPRHGEPAPTIARLKVPGWEHMEQGLETVFDTLCDELGSSVIELRLPDMFKDAARHRACINHAEMAHHFQHYAKSDWSLLGAETRSGIEAGQASTATEYLEALEYQRRLRAAMTQIFEACDVVICPAALGVAPKGLSSTGDSIFNGLWTLAGTPAITLPIMNGYNGLPIGAQFVAAERQDQKLLGVARWVLGQLKTR